MIIIFWSPWNHDKYVCRKRQAKTKYSNSVIKKLNKWRSFLYKMFRFDKYHFIISSIWSLLKEFKHSLPSISGVHTEEEEDRMMLTAVGRKGDLLDYFQNLSYSDSCAWNGNIYDQTLVSFTNDYLRLVVWICQAADDPWMFPCR